MCSEQEIVTLVKLAQKQEDVNPKEAAHYYLQAAEVLLQQSSTHPEKEDEYIAVANKLYLKAKKSVPCGRVSPFGLITNCIPLT